MTSCKNAVFFFFGFLVFFRFLLMLLLFWPLHVCGCVQSEERKVDSTLDLVSQALNQSPL